MIKPIWIILFGAIIVVFFLTNPFGNGLMSENFENLQYSMATIAYAGELAEIKLAINEFMKIMKDPYSSESKNLAKELDSKINKLSLVKDNCNRDISTLELAKLNQPYTKLQEICPILKELSFTQAVDLWYKLN